LASLPDQVAVEEHLVAAEEALGSSSCAFLTGIAPSSGPSVCVRSGYASFSCVTSSSASPSSSKTTVSTCPAELERDIVLRDGKRLRLRPIRPEDQDRLIEFHERVSRHTPYQRFFAVMCRLPPDWARLLANVNYERGLACSPSASRAERPSWSAWRDTSPPTSPTPPRSPS
jgi:hypothetical protein